MAFSFRPMKPSDRDRIKELHEQLFPIQYSDAFYDAIVSSGAPDASALLVGPELSKLGRNLFCLVVENKGKVIGFLIAQEMSADQCEVPEIHLNASDPVMYILTVGVDESYQRLGIGQALVQHLILHTVRDTACKGIFLHVLRKNLAAVAFYERLGFSLHSHLPDYYEIDGTADDAMAYWLETKPPSPRPSLLQLLPSPDWLLSAIPSCLSFVLRKFIGTDISGSATSDAADHDPHIA